jgi:hypothetical protein
MLSTLPKLADRAFILGFVMPVLLFVLGILWLFSDVAPISGVIEKLSEKKSFEQLTYILLSVWALAILLQLLNLPLFQILEGYRWPLSAMRGLKAGEERRYFDIKQPYDELNQQIRAIEKDGGKPSPNQQGQLDNLRRQLVRQFPLDQRYLLPTRFGNAIRAFETYSNYMYGADAIPLWLRLATVVPKDFMAAIEDARAQVNFLVNFGFLATLFAVVAVTRFAVWEIAAGGRGLYTAAAAATTIAAAILVRIVYFWSIERVYAWGELVKSAFDCYLPALANQLGYRLLAKQDGRMKFWQAVSRAAIFNQRLRPENWPQADTGKAEAPTASGEDGNGPNNTED